MRGESDEYVKEWLLSSMEGDAQDEATKYLAYNLTPIRLIPVFLLAFSLDWITRKRYAAYTLP